jgi:hypothetical protein
MAATFNPNNNMRSLYWPQKIEKDQSHESEMQPFAQREWSMVRLLLL